MREILGLSGGSVESKMNVGKKRRQAPAGSLLQGWRRDWGIGIEAQKIPLSDPLATLARRFPGKEWVRGWWLRQQDGVRKESYGKRSA